MFIKKSEYEHLLDLHERVLDENLKLTLDLEAEKSKVKALDKISEDRIKGYVQKCDELKVEIANLKSNLSIMKDRYDTSEDIRIKLIDQNKRLIEMVDKFLCEEMNRKEEKI